MSRPQYIICSIDRQLNQFYICCDNLADHFFVLVYRNPVFTQGAHSPLGTRGVRFQQIYIISYTSYCLLA